MRSEYRMKQVTVFLSVFLLLNFLMFLPSYYSFNISPGKCAELNSPDESVELKYSYQRELCGFIFGAWASYLTQGEDLRPLIIPFLAALIVASVYSYYKKLKMRWEGDLGESGSKEFR